MQSREEADFCPLVLRPRPRDGDVAGRILVEQGVVEQDLLVGDRAVIGHQGHLAEVAGPFIHSDGGLEGRENSLAVGALDDAEPHQGFTRDDETKDVGVERCESSRRFTRRVALEPHYAPDLVHAK